MRRSRRNGDAAPSPRCVAKTRRGRRSSRQVQYSRGSWENENGERRTSCAAAPRETTNAQPSRSKLERRRERKLSRIGNRDLIRELLQRIGRDVARTIGAEVPHLQIVVIQQIGDVELQPRRHLVADLV